MAVSRSSATLDSSVTEKDLFLHIYAILVFILPIFQSLCVFVYLCIIHSVLQRDLLAYFRSSLLGISTASELLYNYRHNKHYSRGYLSLFIHSLSVSVSLSTPNKRSPPTIEPLPFDVCVPMPLCQYHLFVLVSHSLSNTHTHICLLLLVLALTE